MRNFVLLGTCVMVATVSKHVVHELARMVNFLSSLLNCRRKTQAASIRRSFSRQRSSRIQEAMNRASSQSFTEQHKRLAQQDNQAQAGTATSRTNANAADGGAKPMRNTALQTLMSVREEEPADTLAESPVAQPAPQGPTGTTAAIPIPAGLKRTSGPSQGSGKRVSPKAVHYGMTEKSSPLPVLHSPFASVGAAPALDAEPVLNSVDDNLQPLQNKL